MRPFELGTGNVLKILQSNENTPCKTLNARVVDYQGRQLSFTRGEVVLVSQTFYPTSFILEKFFFMSKYLPMILNEKTKDKD